MEPQPKQSRPLTGDTVFCCIIGLALGGMVVQEWWSWDAAFLWWVLVGGPTIHWINGKAGI